MKPHRTVYQELVNQDNGGPRHVIFAPRDKNQVRNFRKEVERQNRLSHNAMFNVYHLCYQLKMNNCKAEPQDFIKNLSVYPNVIVHMIAQTLIEGLEIVLKMSTEPIMLHYDTVFNMGDFYLSTLLLSILCLKAIQSYHLVFWFTADASLKTIYDLWK